MISQDVTMRKMNLVMLKNGTVGKCIMESRTCSFKEVLHGEIVELGETLKEHHRIIPPRLYLCTDGGADRRITFHRVQMALVALFLKQDLDDKRKVGCR